MRNKILPSILLCAGFLFLTLLTGAIPGRAAPAFQESTPQPNLSISDNYCISCHGQQGLTYTLEDGSELDLHVDPKEHASSVHGSAGYACVQCHTNIGEYPHPEFSAANRRDVTLKLNELCQSCHPSEHDKTQDSVHSRALAAGNTAAAVCTDCHTAHAVQDWVDETTQETLPEARTQIAQTCAKCHNEIYQKYLTSVHGSALNEENNPDVPTCIDCHGVHNIADPTTDRFRLSSPQMCAKCHTDHARMAKYGISTEVLNTYVADFHGTTVSIFQQQSPDAETNKPVCYDCHGIHDIKWTDDPEKGLQVKANILATCQKCHPDAADNFSDAWLSHYIPSPDKAPLVFYVNLFYKLLIPTVLGGMTLLVVMDFSRSAINRRKKLKATALPAEHKNILEAVASALSELEVVGEPDQNFTSTEESGQIIQGLDTRLDESSPIDQPPNADDQLGEEHPHG